MPAVSGLAGRAAARRLCQPVAVGGQRWRCCRASGKDVYVVKRGDTLHSIAAALGVDFRSLVIWNNIDNPNHIVVGQGLRTQSPGSASAEQSKPERQRRHPEA
jgi:nucleoid-associated protein YgaU